MVLVMFLHKSFAKMFYLLLFRASTIFGHQRYLGQRRDNPKVFDARYNDNTIQAQYSVKPITGNVRASASKWNIIDKTPLKKRQKKELSKALLVLAMYTLFILWQYLNY